MTTTADIIRFGKAALGAAEERWREFNTTRLPVTPLATRLAVDRFVSGATAPRLTDTVANPWKFAFGSMVNHPSLIFSSDTPGPGGARASGAGGVGAPGGLGGPENTDPNLRRVVLFLEDAHRRLLDGDPDGYLCLVNALSPEESTDGTWASSAATWSHNTVSELSVQWMPYLRNLILGYLRGDGQNSDSYDRLIATANNSPNEVALIAIAEMALRFNNPHIINAMGRVEVQNYGVIAPHNLTTAYALATVSLYGAQNGTQAMDEAFPPPAELLRDRAASSHPQQVTALHYLRTWNNREDQAPLSPLIQRALLSATAVEAERWIPLIFRRHIQAWSVQSLESFRNLRDNDPVFVSYILNLARDSRHPRYRVDFIPYAVSLMWAVTQEGDVYSLTALVREIRPIALREGSEQEISEQERNLLQAARNLDISIYRGRFESLSLPDRFAVAMALHELRTLSTNPLTPIFPELSSEDRERYFISDRWKDTVVTEITVVLMREATLSMIGAIEHAQEYADICLGEMIEQVGYIGVNMDFGSQLPALIQLRMNNPDNFREILFRARQHLAFLQLMAFFNNLSAFREPDYDRIVATLRPHIESDRLDSQAIFDAFRQHRPDLFETPPARQQTSQPIVLDPPGGAVSEEQLRELEEHMRNGGKGFGDALLPHIDPWHFIESPRGRLP